MTGAGGQLGRALKAAAPEWAAVDAVTHGELDIADEQSVTDRFRTTRPEAVINTAAFTSVDAAESETTAAERTNSAGARILAVACERIGARLIHMSTDYVFAGDREIPYRPDDSPRPISAYGRTKLAGELAVRATLPSTSAVVRTSWLYAATGRNFLTRMLDLMNERPVLRVVDDQVGCPTAAAGLANVLWAFVRSRGSGIYHWSDAGETTWYQFAAAIADDGVDLGLIPRRIEIIPIRAVDYSTAAQRPRYSLLDRATTEDLLGCRALPWRETLRTTMMAIVRGSAQGDGA